MNLHSSYSDLFSRDTHQAADIAISTRSIAGLAHSSFRKSSGQKTSGRVKCEDAVLTGTKSRNRRLFAIADGLGGRPSGDIASVLAIQTLESCFRVNPHIRIEDLMQEAQMAHDFAAEDDPGLARMATTLTAFILDGDNLTWSHLGDSRLYLMRDGTLHQLTSDHMVFHGDGDVLSPESDRLTAAFSPGSRHQPEAGSEYVRPGDVLVLMTDGVWSVVDDASIREILDHNDTPAACCDALLDAVVTSGCQQDHSAVVVKLS